MAKELLNNLVKQLHDAYDKEIVLKRDELGEKYEDFIDALDALYVNAIDSVVEAMLDKKVYSEFDPDVGDYVDVRDCLLYTSPSPRDLSTSRMPSSA